MISFYVGCILMETIFLKTRESAAIGHVFPSARRARIWSGAFLGQNNVTLLLVLYGTVTAQRKVPRIRK